jgi:hypothetical protein
MGLWRGCALLAEASVECLLPDQVVDEMEAAPRAKHPQAQQKQPHLLRQRIVVMHARAIVEDGCQRARVPALRIAHGQDHLRLWVRRRQLPPEVGARPVDNGAVVGEERSPVDQRPDLLALKRLTPEDEPLGMREVLLHMVARVEAQPHQCSPQRCRPRATKPGADNQEGRRRYARRAHRWGLGMHHGVRLRSFPGRGAPGIAVGLVRPGGTIGHSRTPLNNQDTPSTLSAPGHR